MTKPIITAEQFNNFPLVDGVRKCPTGDYSQILFFQNCEFESDCIFAGDTKFDCCNFRNWNRFGKACQFHACYFGSVNSFAAACDFTGFCSFQHGNNFELDAVFRNRCAVGNNNTFRGSARFEAHTYFGGNNWFGDGCQFGPANRFGDDCQFGSNCIFERANWGGNGYLTKPGYPFLALAGAGSSNRTTYFYNTTEGVIVRSGCFLGTVEQFCDKVMQDVKGDAYHPKAVEYIGMAKLAIASFKAREPKTDNTVVVGDSRQLPPSTDENSVSIDDVEDAEGGFCVRLRMPGYSDMLFPCSSAVEYKAAVANANAELKRRLKMKGRLT